MKGHDMSLENNIKCDYENCQQRYLSEPHNWWIVGKDEDETGGNLGVTLRPLSREEYEQIVEEQTLAGEVHCCCLDHAMKLAARLCEELIGTTFAAPSSTFAAEVTK